MQRSKVKAFTDHSLYILVHNNGIAVHSAAVQYAMSDGGNLAGILDHSVVCILQCFHYHLNGRLVGWHRLLDHELVLAGRLMGQL